MSKILYPKPKGKASHRNLKARPYHVEYTDPNGDLEPEWKYYNSEAAVKMDAWYQCRFLGFRKNATLYDRDERK